MADSVRVTGITASEVFCVEVNDPVNGWTQVSQWYTSEAGANAYLAQLEEKQAIIDALILAEKASFDTQFPAIQE